MSDDVVAVLAGAQLKREGAFHPDADLVLATYRGDARDSLNALTAAGYAVVRVPEGVAVPHGARLVEVPNAFSLDTRLYAVEATP